MGVTEGHANYNLQTPFPFFLKLFVLQKSHVENLAQTWYKIKQAAKLVGGWVSYEKL